MISYQHLDVVSEICSYSPLQSPPAGRSLVTRTFYDRVSQALTLSHHDPDHDEDMISVCLQDGGKIEHARFYVYVDGSLIVAVYRLDLEGATVRETIA
jgi:hypothetical protein